MNEVTHQKTYSVQDVERRLPLVRAIVRDLKERLARLESLHEQQAAERSFEARETIGREMRESIAFVQECVEELEELGAEVKDLHRGLMDWRHEHDGRVVYLCWLDGEEHLSHWHELDTGFPGRQPITGGKLLAGDEPNGGKADNSPMAI
jgi:hypothetical protein